MDIYSWILCFFIYALYGWIWESSLVSIETKKLTNRGFLKGPLIPIYGFGAILILFTTEPFRDNMLLCAIIASLSVTVMELFTGLAMEALFHVRYWDYSRFRLNFKGYISLISSSVWAVFSLLLIYVIDRPVTRFLVSTPDSTKKIIVSILIPLFIFDFILSVREAVQLRKVIDSVTSELHELSERAEIKLTDLKDMIDLEVSLDKESLAEALDTYDLKRSLFLKKIEDAVTEGMNEEKHERYLKVKSDIEDLRKRSEDRRKKRVALAKVRWTSYRNALLRNTRARSVRLEKEIRTLLERNE